MMKRMKIPSGVAATGFLCNHPTAVYFRRKGLFFMRKPLRFKALLSIALLLVSFSTAISQDADERRAWNQPVKPFRIVGNIYYVGVAGVTSFLITTPAGHILLDSGLPETVPRIQESIKQLGFKLEDVKILLNSHAHFDHAGGLAELKKLTNARLMIAEGDAEIISNGGRGDLQWGDRLTFEAAKVDRVLHDKDKVELGGVTMIARITPGHTKGNTTWTMKVREGERDLDVVFAGSTTAPGYKLVRNPLYPNITEDYERTFALLRSLKCDVFLAPHGQFFALDEKRQRLEKGEKPNPFIDPQGYKNFIGWTEKAYQRQLKEEMQKGN
jgi:metallo-beta-lactamase class B